MHNPWLQRVLGKFKRAPSASGPLSKSHRTVRGSEPLYQSLFENAIDGMLLIEDRVLVDCNKQALQILGVPNKQTLPLRDPIEMSIPLEQDGHTSLLLANAKLEEALAKGDCHYEWLHFRADGTHFLAEVTLSAFSVEGQS